MKTNFLRSISIINKNRFINRPVAILRHTAWAVRKLLNLFPYDLKLGNKIIRIKNLSVANGVGALVNAMGYYDPNNMFFIKEILQTGVYESFFDIGANIGIYSLIATDQKYPIKVFAFEPHPNTFLLLQENILLNSANRSVTCIQKAMSNADGIVQFMDKAGDPENHILNETANDGIKVESCRADSFCKEKGIIPQIVKIDVEGFENQVLEGFGSLLSEIQLFFVECWNLPETKEILNKNAGFMGPFKVDLKNRTLTNADIHIEDWVFIRPQALRTICAALKFKVAGE